MKEVTGNKYVYLTYYVHLDGIKELIGCQNAPSGKVKKFLSLVWH